MDMELGFRPLPGNEYWQADVAAVGMHRWNQVGTAANLQGSPELVAQVLSPSNTYSEMADRERTCFAGGALEFWLVDPTTRSVRVTRSTGTFHEYAANEEIPLAAFGEPALNVAAICEPEHE